MKILIYEDTGWRDLLPLTFIKCVFEIRCGYDSVLDKIRAVIPDGEIGLWVRDYIKPLMAKRYNLPVNDTSFFGDDLLVVNGRWLPSSEGRIVISEEKIVSYKGEIIYGLVRKETVQKFWNGDIDKFLSGIKENVRTEEKETRCIRYPWDLIVYNPSVLKDDFIRYGRKGIKGEFHSIAAIVGDSEKLYIEEGAKIHPFVVIDTTHGPVYIDRGAEIFPSARIEGPCYIGKDTQIMPGANIREGNSFGDVCRIGGEVEESIFYSYANKYHDGFIGHSYIGEFVNLGALTTNSDLKNDYSNVSVYLNGKPQDTGSLKVGSFIGDHTKTSIGTLFNTGTIAGLMCNITAGGILPKYFPSFAWYVNNKFMKGYGLDMMINTAKTVMGRRKRQWLDEEEYAIRVAYEMTEEERKEAIKKSRKTSK
ncbi:MAG TPA: putative sugar nucleotidyl transferase [bacterium]|nr:putative sugar nucleotidyl transferase [bacterium]HPP30467.1 putative sugar nucleotidyl transferase [bacterium]